MKHSSLLGITCGDVDHSLLYTVVDGGQTFGDCCMGCEKFQATFPKRLPTKSDPQFQHFSKHVRGIYNFYTE
jgi:hypothetical protein